jgi:hypothetical protein
MRRLVVAGIAALVFAVSAAPVLAVPPHNHWLTTGSGDVVHVGPYVCENPDIFDAWLNFHVNVHVGVPGTQAFTNDGNPVSIAATLGPAQMAASALKGTREAWPGPRRPAARIGLPAR